MTWLMLHERFLKLRDKTGASKITSYSMSVYFSPEGRISVELGTYDISGWPRHTYLGSFESELDALVATKIKIIEAEKAVAEEGETVVLNSDYF